MVIYTVIHIEINTYQILHIKNLSCFGLAGLRRSLNDNTIVNQNKIFTSVLQHLRQFAVSKKAGLARKPLLNPVGIHERLKRTRAPITIKILIIMNQKRLYIRHKCCAAFRDVISVSHI